MLKRYTKKEMGELWTEEAKFNRWLRVEIAVLAARVTLNDLSHEAYEAIRDHAKVNIERIDRLEAEYNHDLIAFVEDVQASIEEAGFGQFKSEFHKGLTSYDIEDPALMLILNDAVRLIYKELGVLKSALLRKAREHRETLMIARTHGQFAEPDVFGRLLLVFVSAVDRSMARLRAGLSIDLGEGKLSGAVGTYAGMNPRIEQNALASLGLLPSRAETQILQRDRLASLLADLSTAGGTIEQMARTLWEMMRSDAGELQEPRGKNQRGSSAMPHKKNPILTERLVGMPRLLRAYAHAAQENIATPECRDISQSCVERVILPDATIILHYMVVQAIGLVENLVVFPEGMQKNFDASRGTWAGQRLKVALIDAGIEFSVAYDFVKEASFAAVTEKEQLIDICRTHALSNKDMRTAEAILGANNLEALFDPRSYLAVGVQHMFDEFEEET